MIEKITYHGQSGTVTHRPGAAQNPRSKRICRSQRLQSTRTGPRPSTDETMASRRPAPAPPRTAPPRTALVDARPLRPWVCTSHHEPPRAQRLVGALNAVRLDPLLTRNRRAEICGPCSRAASRYPLCCSTVCSDAPKSNLPHRARYGAAPAASLVAYLYPQPTRLLRRPNPLLRHVPNNGQPIRFPQAHPRPSPLHSPPRPHGQERTF